MFATIFFKKNRAIRYGLSKFQTTVTGEVISNDPNIISIIPMRCSLKKIRNIKKEDIISIDYY